MLDRNSLKKQFEEATKQEIINHNRQIEASNDRLRNMEEGLLSLNKKVYNIEKSNVDKFNEIKRDILEINKTIKDFFAFHNSNCKTNSENFLVLNNNLSFFEKLHEKLVEDYRRQQIEIENLQNFVKEKDMQLSLMQKSIENMLPFVKKLMEESLKEVSDKIQVFPKDIQQIKDHIEKDNEIKSLDFNCCMQEVRAHNRETYILEKKVEKLFILIDRLSAKKEEK